MKIKIIYFAAVGMMIAAGQALGQAPVITGQPTNVTAVYGSTAIFNVSVSGSGPFAYQWLLNGTNMPNIITTVAGNGTNGFSGDGGSATNAKLNSPGCVTFDASGNLYISDSGNNRVRKVDTNGIISTVVGNGIYDNSGDGGAATNAGLHTPAGLAFDGSGNLYLVANGSHCIRKMAGNGIITTIAGNGAPGFSGDGGPATNASLNTPVNIALDSVGNLFFSDVHNNRVRKVDTNGIISTVAGSGNLPFSGDGGAATNAGMYYPNGLAIDAWGNLFIADAVHDRIRMVDTNGIITTVAGGGYINYGNYGDGNSATNATLSLPQSVAFDLFGNLYIGDTDHRRIRRVGTNGIINTVAGNGNSSYCGDGGPAILACLSGVTDLAIDASRNLYFPDWANNRVRKVDFHNQPSLTLTSVSVSNTGSYSVIVSNAYGSATSEVATLAVADPFIISQPSNSAGIYGGNAVFNVTAIGTAPLKYQWYSQTGGTLSGKTSSSLTLSSLAAAAMGSYYVVITNGASKVATSAVVTLTVADPYIVHHPTNLNVGIGSNATFSVTAIGTGPLTYQWFSQTGGLLDGSTNSALTLTSPTTNANGGYYVVITNGLSQTVTSSVATLQVCFPPAIIAQPTNQTLQSGGTATMSVTVSGTGSFNYQWLVNGAPVQDIISTVAGGGGWGASGDGGAATNAMLRVPAVVTVDSAGNLYIADPANVNVRKVDTNGIISTFAGTGVSGYSGDGGAATNASLNFPEGLGADVSGNIYISDVNRIEKINANGIITTVAGNGTNGFSGDGGLAINARLDGPAGMAFDGSGNLLVADYNNGRVRKVDVNGVITTVAGGGTGGDGNAATNAALAQPDGVGFDALGNLYISESGGRVRMVDATGMIRTIAGGGTGADAGAATNAIFTLIRGIALDHFGNLFISDMFSNVVYKVNPGGRISVVTGGSYFGGYSGDGGPAINGRLNWPVGVATDSAQNLYITDSYNARIRKVDFHNQPKLILGGTSPDDSGSYQVVVTSPYGSATSSLGVLLVYDPPSIVTQPASQTNGVNGSMTFTVETGGAGPYTFQWQHNGTNLPNTIMTVAGNGAPGFSGDGGAATNACLNSPQGVISTYGSGFFISDTGNHRVRYVDDNGIITTIMGNGTVGYAGDAGPATNASLSFPLGGNSIAWLSCLAVADSSNHVIRAAAGDGNAYSIAGNGLAGFSGDGGPAINASLNYPTDVSAEYWRGYYYIADQRNQRIRRVDDSGGIITVAGNGLAGYSGDGGTATNASLNYPSNVLPDGLGNFYITDQGNHCIRKVNSSGIITTVAGNGSAGFSGDGGLAINASLNHPTGVILDTVGNLYIADTGNHRIRQVDGSGIITTLVGNGLAGFAGDGGDALTASLSSPSSMWLAYWNFFYIADTGNHRVRKVTLANQPFLILNNLTFNDAGSYSVIVSTPAGSLTSSNASLVIADPFISVSPADQLVPADADAAFSVSALGGSTLHYQWKWNGTNISGANASNFTVSSAQCTNDGIYQVVVSDSAGSVTSGGAMLIAVSASATLSIETTGSSSGIRIGWSPVSPCDRLQASTNSAGPWIDATTQNNPQTNTATGKAIFYRVISH